MRDRGIATEASFDSKRQSPSTYPLNLTKRKLLGGEFVFGVSISEMRSIALPRIFAGLGYDFLFFDMEHSADGFETTCDMVWASRAAGITPIVRVPDPERFYISRVLDAGAQGVIVPRVETVEQVDRIVGYCRYPPEGDRGAAFGGRHSDFQPAADPRALMRQANEEVLAGIQIETVPGLERVQALASRPGVDLLFIGPQDLSVALDVPNQYEAPIMDDAIRRIIAEARRNGLPVGVQGRNAQLAGRWMAEGVRFVVFGSTVMLLTQAAKTGIGDLRAISAKLDRNLSVEAEG
jgi:2-keto-3-deoxy-L-rhamnonate aldolase RhmA